MATQFIPYSVQMRSRNYVLSGKKWIPESVAQLRAERAELAKFKTMAKQIERSLWQTAGGYELLSGMSWGEHADNEQFRQDLPYLRMTEEQWRVHLQADKSQSIEEVARLRKARAAYWKPEEPVVEEPKTCQYWYTEYTKFPHLYFSSEEEQQSALQELYAEWRVSAGRWRLGLLDQAATKIQAAVTQYMLRRVSFDCRVCRKTLHDGYDVCRECEILEEPELYNRHDEDHVRCYQCLTYNAIQRDKLNHPLCQLCLRDETPEPELNYDSDDGPEEIDYDSDFNYVACWGCSDRKATHTNDKKQPLCMRCLLEEGDDSQDEYD